MGAFAAVKDSGAVAIWGDAEAGGAPSASVREQLAEGVEQVDGNYHGLTARKKVGSKQDDQQEISISWGDRALERDSALEAERRAQGIRVQHSNGFATASIYENGTVKTTGDPTRGGDSSAATE